MSAAILRTGTGRRHWLAEPVGADRYRALCGQVLHRPQLLPETDPAGVTCSRCTDRLAGTR